MKKAFLACLTCLGVLFACTPEEGGSVTAGLSVDADKIEATTDGGEFNIKVTCGVATTTTIAYLEGGEGWITLMPKVLKGNGTLKFTLGKYLEYDATRTATATIEGTGVRQVINISQTGRPAPVATELDLDRYNVYADVIGGEFPIAVSAAGAWTAVSDASWCTVQNGSATGIGEFKVVVPKSEDYQYRTAKITVTAGTLTREVFVQHVGTKIGDLVWANANVNEPDTFCESCEGRGKLYQWNTKNGFPSYTAQSTEEGNTGCYGDPEKVVPGFEGGPFDTCAEKWTEENDPCPAGWRVPTHDELKKLIGDDNPPASKFTVDFWRDKFGMSVSGAFCGLDRDVMLAECSKGNPNGAIFIPIAGGVNRDSGKQTEWWNVMLWSSDNVGQTWDMLGIWMCSADNNDAYGTGVWYGSKTALSIRCVLAN